MIRRYIEQEVRELLEQFPAVGILGPRQVGKTTLAFQIAESISPEPIYLDLESPTDQAKLREPELYFADHNDRVIILDEIQRVPELFAPLRSIIDKRKRNGQKTGQFIILGSASLELLKQSSESLAGRIAYKTLSGLSPKELENENDNKLWLRGGFPDSYLAADDQRSFVWRQNFITTYLERDIPQFGIRISASVLRQFWTMLAHAQGGILNLSTLARGLGNSVPTINRYLDLLDDLFLIRKLQPWSSNVGKRLVKSPKVYIRDSGLTHALLRITDMEELFSNPVLGGSWEGFILEMLVSNLPSWASPYFYRTAAGAEVDLVIDAGNDKRIAIEIKRSMTPTLSKGFVNGCDDIKATHRFFVYPGDERFRISKDVEAVPLKIMLKELYLILGL
ncbi:ATP-binding protein [Sphingobacterium pedocola]|uniref:ATPase n=1 Tax=Sphingobacterium pedocola TaxID=2082722 RepID=A0ABR9T501_9SPHI|nr:ATP-binding protein [Sphingobacterium pedocola]MBE8719979.1 ATPase [Sphingobacterium pedocola]